MEQHIRAALLAAVILAFAVSPTAGAENLFADLKSGKPDVVSTEDGPVQGYEQEGVVSFLGIPYAAPPVGPLRWMPPEPPEKWETVRDAGDFGDSCVQTNTFGVFATPSRSEDCLYLNVFASPADARDGLRPVMIWIHGGGLINGRADDHDGRRLVSDGNVVVVSINYRLNVFGFFAHPALDSEGHPYSNYALLDQQAAMRWVQRNIRAFGGDPDNLTLFGESAGGLPILFNMVSPGAAGLFHKVILQSGVSAAPQTPLDVAQRQGMEFAELLGCTDQSAECLRSKSVEEIIEKAGAFTARSVRVVDGTILPDQMQKRMADGDFHRVPILIGNNLNEWTWFVGLRELATNQPLAAEDYEAHFADTFGPERAAKIVAEYPLADFPSASEAVAHALTSRNFVCPSRRVMNSAAQFVPIYVYEFMDVNAPYYFPSVSFPYGAAHTLDIQYLFPRYHGARGEPQALNEEQGKLSATMISYWSTFAAKGDPNSDATPDWPPWAADNEQTQLLDVPQITTAKDSGVDRKCDFWDNL